MEDSTFDRVTKPALFGWSPYSVNRCTFKNMSVNSVLERRSGNYSVTDCTIRECTINYNVFASTYSGSFTVRGTAVCSTTWVGDVANGTLVDLGGNQFGGECATGADCNNDGIVDYGQCRDGSLPDYNGNNIPDCCEQGIPCEVGHYPVQWRVSEGGNGHWYAVSALSTDCWDQARSAAASRGGYLTTLTSASENQFAADVLRRVAGSNVAVGGYKDLSTGLWNWVTAEPWQYTNWQGGEPGCCLPNEWWLDVNSSTGRWRDRVQCIAENPTFPAMMVTEWSADCNNDGIVDKGQILRGQLADSDNDGIPNVCDCSADLFVDGRVGGDDLGVLLVYWGPTTSSSASRRADLNHDGTVNGDDLGYLLTQWGPCPG